MKVSSSGLVSMWVGSRRARDEDVVAVGFLAGFALERGPRAGLEDVRDELPAEGQVADINCRRDLGDIPVGVYEGVGVAEVVVAVEDGHEDLGGSMSVIVTRCMFVRGSFTLKAPRPKTAHNMSFLDKLLADCMSCGKCVRVTSSAEAGCV